MVSFCSGVNQLVVKLTNLRGSWNAYMRLTGPQGESLDGLTFLRQVPRTPNARGAPGTVEVVDPGRWLQRRSREVKPPQALKDWVHYLVRATPEDPASQAVETVLARWVGTTPRDARGRAEAHLLLARLRRDPAAERDEVERALALDPANPWALLRLARLEASGRRHLEVARILGAILRRAPGFLPAELELAETYRTAGLDATAAAMLESILEGHPGVAGVVLERANLALAMDDAVRADRLQRRYHRTSQTDVSTLRSLADLALRRGDVGGAVAWLGLAVRHAPHLTFLHQELASLHEGRGEVDQAVESYRSAVRIDPHAATALVQMGHTLYRAHRKSSAWQAWRQALRIQPQNAELRAYLAMLTPGRKKGMAERFRQDPGPLIRAARQAGTHSNLPARILLDATVTEVHPSGLSRTLRQRLLQVIDEAGAAWGATHVIPYNPDRQAVDLRAARVHRASGQVVSRGLQRERDLSEPWAGLWYDIKALEVRFAGLRPGDIVELEYLVEDVAESNLLADYFGDLVDLQQQLPVRRFRYTLLTPADRPIRVRHPRLERVRYGESVQGRVRVQRWTAADLGRVAVEPKMPGLSEVADYIHVSTYSSWRQVGRWYWNLIEEQLKPSRRVADQARRITASSRTQLERIQAIHNFVAQNTRYVGLEFGIHSYKPYSAAQVLARRFGDCKDKATLMIALLKQVGIDAQMVLVRTRRRGRVDPSPPSLAPFDHAIVYIPARRLYLDATAEFAGTGELPYQDQGVMALHVPPTGAPRLVTTPVLGASQNTTRVEEQIWVAADGKVRIREDRTITGQAAHKWRSYYQAADSRRDRFEKTYNGWIGSATVRWVKMPGLEELERPVQVRAEVMVDGLARLEGPGRISLPPGSGVDTSLVQAYGRLTTRVHPLQLDFPWRSLQRVRLAPPAGWSVAVVPRDQSVTTPFGRYIRRSRRLGQELEVTQEVWLEQARIEPQRYARFREFLQQLDRLLAERVVLVKR